MDERTDSMAISPTLHLETGRGGSGGSGGVSPFGQASAGVLLRGCLWTRIALNTVLFVLAAVVSRSGDLGAFSAQLWNLFLLVLFSFGFSIFTTFGMRIRAFQDFLLLLQVAWDLLFATAWIYLTGGTGSLFVFLYLIVIIESSLLLGPYGSALTAFLCGLLYWVELHLEYHGALFQGAQSLAAPVVTSPGKYPAANLIFILAAMLSAVWLTGALRQRFSKTRLLLAEKSNDIQDLLHLNESIVRCIRSGLITLNKERRITSANQAAVVITGYPPDEVLDRHVETFLGPIPLEELEGQENGAPLPFRWEQPFLRKDDRRLTLGCSGAILRDHRDESFGHLIIFQDLTHYKQMEGELRRNEKLAAIGELAAGLAHEIRNPLASLYGSIQLLQGAQAQDENRRRLMGIILKESERLNGLITDFLAFASPNTGERESIHLLPLVEEVLVLFEAGAHRGEDVRIAVDVDPELRLLANRRQIQQILWNLLLNGVQAMPHGGELGVRARTKRDAGGAPRVLMEVWDTGRGIPRDDLGKIFDPFYTSRDQGTGLGLAIVHRIVENHGGRVRVESQESRGSTFQIDLPALPAPLSPDVPAASAAPKGPARPAEEALSHTSGELG